MLTLAKLKSFKNMNDNIEHLDNGDFKVVRANMTPEALEADKPKFNADDKEAKKLFSKIQALYDACILAKMDAVRDPSKEGKVQALYDEYDDLVDVVVAGTHGQAPAFWSDPMTFDTLEMAGHPMRGLTYNEMAELQGQLAFGN